MAGLEIRLLGPFQVGLGAETITEFESNKVRALLAYLAVENGYAQSREVVVDLFWPELPPKRASSNLSQALYNLRRLFGDQRGDAAYLLRSRVQVGFNPGAVFWLDVHEFTTLMDGPQAWVSTQGVLDHAQTERLQAAVDLYRGDFLEGLTFDSSLAFDEWVLVKRQRLQRWAILGLSRLAEAHTADGDVESALSYARRWVAMDPLDEAANRQLMRLLAANGQRSQALSQFEQLRVLLSEELKVEPEPETLKVRDQVRAGTSSAARLPKRWDNLPAFLSPLVGRREELSIVRGRLESPDCRLLTILGPGGSGKTRLALEAARNSRSSFQHGVIFVALNPLESSESIPPAILEALALPRLEGEAPGTQLLNFLRDKALLLVLDGCEHLLAGVGLVADLLRAAPGLKVLATSRVRLNLQVEHLYRLPGMHYPAPSASAGEILHSDAVQLLLSGLRRGGHEYEPGPEDVEHLHRICAQVQGMPLGILLAASWGQTFSIEEIVARVSRTLDFLSADWADVPARQRSLRATFDHTWVLLGKREREIFQSLSVFRGAFTRKAARQVSGASPHELRALVDRSLLESKTPGWYQVHEMLRQYGLEKLAENPQEENRVYSRHSGYYLEQLAWLGKRLMGPDQEVTLNSIDLEHENYRRAWDWAGRQGLIDLLAPALETLCLYYELRLRYKEGESACRIAAEMDAATGLSGVHFRLLIRLKIWQARFNRMLGKPDLSQKIHQACLSLLDQLPDETAGIRIVKAFLFLEMGNSVLFTDLQEANRWHHASLELYRSFDDGWGTANALCGLGESAVLSGRFADSIDFYQESLSLFRALGDPRGIVVALTGLGGGLFRVGRFQESEDCMQETIQIFKELEDHAGVARSQFNLARTILIQGRYVDVIELFKVCTPILKDLGLRYDYAHVLCVAIFAFVHLGLYEKAGFLIPELLSLCQEIDYPRFLSGGYFELGMIDLAQGENSQACDDFQKSLSIQKEIGNPDERAAITGVLGGAYLKAGDLQRARQHLSEALKVTVELEATWSASWALPWVALYFAKIGAIEWAVAFYATVKNLPIVANSRWLAEEVEADIIAACANYPQGEIAAIQERGRGMDLWETAGELLRELAPE